MNATHCFGCPLIRELVIESVQWEYATRNNPWHSIPDTRDNWTHENVQYAARDSIRALTRGQVKNGSRARRNAVQEFVRVMDEPIRAVIADSPNSTLLNVHALLKSWAPDAYDMDDRSDWYRLVRIMHWIKLALEHGSYRNDALTASPLDAFRGPVAHEISDDELLASAYDALINSAPSSLIGRF